MNTSSVSRSHKERQATVLPLTARELRSKRSAFWKKERERMTLSLFLRCVNGISAYKKFLLKKGTKAQTIIKSGDLSLIPVETKREYLRSFEWKDLLWGGALEKGTSILTATSGSTGAPFYFPRGDALHQQSSIMHELFLLTSGLDLKKPILVVDCFGMGVWIGGLITYEAFKKLGERGYPITVVTPGVNKKEIFDALRHVGGSFTQIILCGYPPFIKDVVDEGEDHGVDWKKYDMRIVFAAEAFSEEFRDYMMEKTGMKNPYRSTMNVYGSADIGTMAQETPLCIFVRRMALSRPGLYKRLFSEATRLPTLAQFVPSFINFEIKEGTVVLTADRKLPLIRYAIGDSGGVFEYDFLEQAFKEEGLDLTRELTRAKLQFTTSELPFVYIYERSDLSIKIYGVIIYPEHVKVALSHKEFSPFITGKFTLFTKHDSNQHEHMEVNIELKPDKKPSAKLEETLKKVIVETLQELSAEYKDMSTHNAASVVPVVRLWPNGDPTYFKGGAKQRWVAKE